VVGESITENNTVENIERLLILAKRNEIPVFISPHYYFRTDHGRKFEGALEKLMHNIGMFDRAGSPDLEGFENSGADWLARYKPYIEDGETVIANPHKAYGPENNEPEPSRCGALSHRSSAGTGRIGEGHTRSPRAAGLRQCRPLGARMMKRGRLASGDSRLTRRPRSFFRACF